MRFLREEERRVEAPGEIAAPAPRRPPRPARSKCARAPGEIGEFGALARRRDDEAAGDRRDAERRCVQKSSASSPSVGDERLGAFQFAPGRDHAAGEARAAVARPQALRSTSSTSTPGARERIGGAESGDAGADHARAHGAVPYG